MDKKQTPRQEVKDFVNKGSLRGVLDQHPNGISQDGIELIIRVVINYCDPKPLKRKRNG